MVAEFPAQRPGLKYLTEGGQETEILYKYGSTCRISPCSRCSTTRGRWRTERNVRAVSRHRRSARFRRSDGRVRLPGEP